MEGPSKGRAVLEVLVIYEFFTIRGLKTQLSACAVALRAS
jgi:hypothetical protein